MTLHAPTGEHTTYPGLLDAFWEYDRALLANDVAALDALFAPGADTARGDGITLAIGHDEISRFRHARTAVPTRTVSSVHIVPAGANEALVMASVRSSTGAPGLQTQLWRWSEGCWRVAAAHVNAPAAPLDRAVWRVAGAPLVPAPGEGALTGLTVAVKDVYAVEGQRLGGGVPSFLREATPEPRNAAAVEALLHHGADVVGIAQTDQFAYSIAGANRQYGVPLNPLAPHALPGGSTSGGTTAVALGWASVALGTDTAGSIRVPSAYQGLWGLRSTHAAVPLDGVLPLAPTFDAAGWITRDADTLRRVTAAMLPAESRPFSGAVTVSALNALSNQAGRDAAESSARALDANSLDLDLDLDEAFAAFRTVQAFEAWAQHGGWITAHPGALDRDVAARFAFAAGVSAAEAEAARAVTGRAASVLRDVVADRVLVLPTTASAPPALNASAEEIDAHRANTLRLCCLAPIAGLPAVAFPSPGDPSVGVCVIGGRGRDLDLVDIAQRASSLR
jgi:amidase